MSGRHHGRPDRSLHQDDRNDLKQEAIQFVRRCNHTLRREYATSASSYGCTTPMTVSPGSHLIEGYARWIASTEAEEASRREQVVDLYLRHAVEDILQGRLSCDALIDDLLSASKNQPPPLVVVWKLHAKSVLCFDKFLCDALCPSARYRKRLRPPRHYQYDVAESNIRRFVDALDSIPHQARETTSAILRHILSTYVETTECPQTHPPVVRVVMEALVKGCFNEASPSTYLLLVDACHHLKQHSTIQTLVKVQLLRHLEQPMAWASSLDVGRAFLNALHVDSFIAITFGHIHGAPTTRCSHLCSMALTITCVCSIEECTDWFQDHFGAQPSTATSSMCGVSSSTKCTSFLAPSKRNLQYMLAILTERVAVEASMDFVDVVLKVIKTHQEHPDIVLPFVQSARRRLNDLKSSLRAKSSTTTTAIPTVTSAIEEEIRAAIQTFLESGKVSLNLRQRILLQDATWKTQLKPGLLRPRDMNDHVYLLGWMQLVHTLAREGIIAPSEYAPFLQSMHNLVQTRMGADAAGTTSLVQFAHKIVELDILPDNVEAKMLRRLQSIENDIHKEWVEAAKVLCVAYPRTQSLLTSLWSALSTTNQAEIIQKLHEKVRTELSDSKSENLQLLARLLGFIFLIDGIQRDVTVAFLDDIVNPPVRARFVCIFRVCAEVVQISLAGEGDTIPKHAHEFMNWMYLRMKYGGLSGESKCDLMYISERMANMTIGNDIVAFASWHRYELHTSSDISSYRFECITQHFMQLSDNKAVAAISIVSGMGKELLLHQEQCSPSVSSASSPHSIQSYNGHFVHANWSSSLSTDQSEPSCRVDIGLLLFCQVLPILFASTENKANVHSALLNIFISAAGATLDKSTRPAKVKAQVCLLLFELIHAVSTHSNVMPHTVSAKAQKTLISFIHAHLMQPAPWPPRVTSVILACFEDDFRALDSAIIASALASFGALQGLSSSIRTKLRALRSFLASSQSNEKLDQVLELEKTEDFSHFFKVIRFWMAWGNASKVWTPELFLAHFTSTPSFNTMLIDIVYLEWVQWTKSLGECDSTHDDKSFPALMLQLASHLIVTYPHDSGQWVLDQSNLLSPWYLLVLKQFSPSHWDTCHRALGSKWLSKMCDAYLAYYATPAYLLPAASHERFPEVLDACLASAIRLNIEFEQEDHVGRLRHIVTPSTLTLLETIPIANFDDGDDDINPSFRLL
ncbi:hypothetical protein Ae201684P_021926 [Aphanomyces euteiches]|nr:hypothetical protein Ae201684P_021926 [Aphanomyces euteiches]